MPAVADLRRLLTADGVAFGGVDASTASSDGALLAAVWALGRWTAPGFALTDEEATVAARPAARPTLPD